MAPLPTKYKPKPPNISWTLNFTFNNPHSNPQAEPIDTPTISWIYGESTDSPRNDLATQEAPIAPSTIWPSIPIFHRPPEKVIINASEAKDMGRNISIVFTIFSGLPKAPSKIDVITSIGEAPSKIIIKDAHKVAKKNLRDRCN